MSVFDPFAEARAGQRPLLERAAGEAQRQQAQLLDLTHDSVIVRDTNDVIAYWNRGAEHLYGWRKEDAMGKVAHQLLQTVFPAPIEDITAALSRTGRWEGELLHKTRYGAPVAVASRWSLQTDALGKPVGTLEANTDITKRKLQRVQADFAQAARVSVLGELTASIAHELNQPLAAITTSGEASLRWLDRPEPDIDEVRASITRMLMDARRASDIIGRVREMAAGRGPERTPLSLDEVIREALVFLRHEIQERGVTVSQQLNPGAPQVLGNRTQLQQVVVNLAVNAMQAMAQAGTADRKLSFRTAFRDQFSLCCIVEDSGPGISPECLPRLFDSFFTTKDSGMGMGLSICRSIIEAHGGTITADNQAAHGGARLCFTLPAERPAD